MCRKLNADKDEFRKETSKMEWRDVNYKKISVESACFSRCRSRML